MLASEVYLGSYLAPLKLFLTRADVTDIYINRPGEVWIEALGKTIERIDAPALTASVLQRLARQIAAIASQGISRENPLLSASLPDGSRVQIVLPPATRGDVAIAIRRHVMADMSLGHYASTGAFENTILGEAPPSQLMVEPGDKGIMAMLQTAVRQRRNILISGGTATGKTTFLNALIAEIPQDERLIFIEDTAELSMRHANAVGLLATRGHMGEAQVTAEDLLIASLRMRPDRIILGEMRGPEALTFLRSVNTGHPGSMSTIHADSPERAIDQLALLVLQAGTRMDWEATLRYIRGSIDLIVQLYRAGKARKVHQIIHLGAI